jgi:protein-tyrosine phosphatase
MNYLVEQANLENHIKCDSAGTSSYHIGSSPDSRMRATAALRGIELLGRARQFDVSDLEKFDLILAMDRQNYRDILSLDVEGNYGHKVRLMCDFATQHREKEVPDPYYGGQQGFDRVIDLLLDACEGLLIEIRQTQSIK